MATKAVNDRVMINTSGIHSFLHSFLAFCAVTSHIASGLDFVWYSTVYAKVYGVYATQTGNRHP